MFVDFWFCFWFQTEKDEKEKQIRIISELKISLYEKKKKSITYVSLKEISHVTKRYLLMFPQFTNLTT